MTQNPLDVFFGRSVVLGLKDRPDSLRRVVEKMKPLLLSAVHPDRNPEMGSEPAARISEAAESIKSASSEDLANLVDLFVSRTKDEGLKNAIRDLKSSVESLKGRLASKENQTAELSRNLSETENLLWNWFIANFQFRDRLPISKEFTRFDGMIPRNQLRYFRLVTQSLGMFKSFEFDLAGRVRFAVKAKTFEEARNYGLFKSQSKKPRLSPEEKVKIIGIERNTDAFFAGSTKGQSDEMTLKDAIRFRKISPFVAVGMSAVIVEAYTMDGLLTNRIRGWDVLEIIHLKEERARLLGEEIPVTPIKRRRRR